MQFLKEDKLRSTVRRLELHKHDHVYSRSNKFCIFHLEKMLVWLLTRLVFSLTCALMIGMIFSRNLARQGYWCNHLARRINKKRISLMCIDSLSVWKPWFLVFVEFVRANYCGACKKNNNYLCMEHVENIYDRKDSAPNICILFDHSAHETCH